MICDVCGVARYVRREKTKPRRAKPNRDCVKEVKGSNQLQRFELRDQPDRLEAVKSFQKKRKKIYSLWEGLQRPSLAAKPLTGATLI